MNYSDNINAKVTASTDEQPFLLRHNERLMSISKQLGGIEDRLRGLCTRMFGSDQKGEILPPGKETNSSAVGAIETQTQIIDAQAAHLFELTNKLNRIA